MEPTIFEPRIKFRPRLIFFKFDLSPYKNNIIIVEWSAREPDMEPLDRPQSAVHQHCIRIFYFLNPLYNKNGKICEMMRRNYLDIKVICSQDEFKQGSLVSLKNDNI